MNRQANPNAGDGKASTTKNIFSRETSVSTTIEAEPAIVWALLASALTGVAPDGHIDERGDPGRRDRGAQVHSG